MSRRACHLLFGIILAFCPVSAGVNRAAEVAPERMTTGDLVALLKAGVSERVILRQVEVTATRLSLTVDTILELRRAGATDSLLESLIGATPEAAGPARVEGGLRVYRVKNELGEDVLHVTNLDGAGRRIGGELPPASPAPPPPAGRPALDESEYDRHSPVIVNVYSPALPGTEPPDLAPGYARFGAFGWLPRPGHRSDSRRLSGSQPAGLFGRPQVIDTRPYSQAPASRRNRASFRRN